MDSRDRPFIFQLKIGVDYYLPIDVARTKVNCKIIFIGINKKKPLK